MNHSKLWLTVGAIGFFLVASSVAMAFFSDHHWYVTYEIASFFEDTCWWVQLAGVALSVVAGIGMAKNLSETSAVRLGLSLIVVGALTAVLAGPSDIFNVHDWKIALILPLLVTFLDGAILVFTGLGG